MFGKKNTMKFLGSQAKLTQKNVTNVREGKIQ